MRRPDSAVKQEAPGGFAANPSVADRIHRQQPTPSEAAGKKVHFEEVRIRDDLRIHPDEDNLVAVVPAHNEGESIYNCLQSLYDGTQWPDLTFVVANNCSKNDKTVEEVLRFVDEHPDFPLALHDVYGLEGRKVGALCYAWEELERDNVKFDFFISMDGDVILDEYCVEDLFNEIAADENVGGVAARYSFLPTAAKGLMDRLWLFYQRVDFASWTMNLLKEENRATYVLGGQVSIMRESAMRDVASHGERMYPWSAATAVEDMELTWKLNDLGLETRCSATARAWVGHMPTRQALWGQRMKWDRGIDDLLRDPSSKHNKSIYLKEPKRQQWRSLVDLLLRVVLYTALPLALLRDSYELFERWWMPVLAFVPILLSMLIGLITAISMPRRRISEVILAALYFPLEGYVWFRTGVWARAWIGALRGEKEDLWASQARSEGKGESSVSGAHRTGRVNRGQTQSTVSSTYGRNRSVSERINDEDNIAYDNYDNDNVVNNNANSDGTGENFASSEPDYDRPIREREARAAGRNPYDPELPSRSALRGGDGKRRFLSRDHRSKDQRDLDRERENRARFANPRRGSDAANRKNAAAESNKKRGNKHRFRWTLLPLFAAATIVFYALTFVSLAWWLPAVVSGLIVLWIAFTLMVSLLQDAQIKRGKKPFGFRWVWALVLVAVLLLATVGRPLVVAALAWARYLVYLAGTAVDWYLYFAWYSLMVVTIVLCVILVIKIVGIMRLRSQGFRP